MANESSTNPQTPPPGNVQVAVLPLAVYRELVGRIAWDLLARLSTLPPDVMVAEINAFNTFKRDVEKVVDIRWETRPVSS